jgi:uncharacterized protein (TIGR00369 family)
MSLTLTASTTETELIKQYLADGWSTYEDDTGFIGLAGPFFYRAEGNSLAFRFPTLPKHHNRNGVLQGGALMTFTDRVCGATSRHVTEAPRTTTMQLNMNFIDAVKIGETVEATATVVRATKQIIFMSVTLTVELRIVAMATGVWKKILSAG